VKPDSVDTAGDDEEGLEGSVSYRKLSLLLAGALTIIVLLMNVLSPDEIPISEGTFQGLLDDQLVKAVTVGDGWLIGALVAEVTVEEQTGVGARPRRGRLVSVDLNAQPTREQLNQWRNWGIEVQPADDAASSKRARGQQTGWALMAILLGVGLYYIVAQAKRSQHSDSPRAMLMKLDAALKSGEISQEDYQKKAATISAEL
jgi:hypothetical protein